VGAHAVIFYTEPRYTKDIDIWVDPTSDNAEKVMAALKKFGAPVDNLTIEDLSNKDMVFQIGIEPNRIDILMGIGCLTFDHAWKKRRSTQYGKEKIHIIDFDDLVTAKKYASRKSDLIDLESLNTSKKTKTKKSK
jgi:hypothetical protein